MNKDELFEKIKVVTNTTREEFDKIYEDKKNELTERYKMCGVEVPTEEDVINFLLTYFKIQLKKAQESYIIIPLVDEGIIDFNAIARRVSKDENEEGKKLFPKSWFSGGKVIPDEPAYSRTIHGIGKKDENAEYQKIVITLRNDLATKFNNEMMYRKLRVPARLVNGTGEEKQLSAIGNIEIDGEILEKEKIEAIIKKYYTDKITTLNNLRKWIETHSGRNDFFICEANVMTIQLGTFDSADFTDESLDITSDVPYINFVFPANTINFVENAQGVIVFGRAYIGKDGMLRAQGYNVIVPKQYLAPKTEDITGEEEWEID